ncbi:hypothetical protein AKO1_005472 [Acrasis kona]|uniref:Uncharacterized protein n=1 Tax=Acrasis kona TaxID=1008807 RepID=A0AAW2YIZ8_9EUKA
MHCILTQCFWPYFLRKMSLRTKCEQELEEHVEEAQEEIDFYKESIQECIELYDSITADPNDNALKSKLIAVLAADYQQGKLLPFWGRSPQPGETYYFRKLLCDIFGIVNHCTWRTEKQKEDGNVVDVAIEKLGAECGFDVGSTLHCPSQSVLQENQTTVFILYT